MLRLGRVVSIDPQKATVKVKFFDMDEEVSYELPVEFPKTGKDKVYWMPKVGDTVVCQMQNETDGFVVGEYYHSQNPPPESDPNKVVLVFEDGTRIEHDKSSGKLTIENPKELVIRIQNTSNLTSPIVTIQGDVVIEGNLFVSGNIQSVGQTTAQSGLKTSPSGQTIFVDDLVSKYNSHTHTDSAGGSTSAPDQLLP